MDRGQMEGSGGCSEGPEWSILGKPREKKEEKNSGILGDDDR